mmetsp:Transcript_28294/g.39344  ORF Transcript_28294/g.39344 Transcript_28294/m.39344 type:complete len:216 (-) Transcript_28294:537-1184(-)
MLRSKESPADTEWVSHLLLVLQTNLPAALSRWILDAWPFHACRSGSLLLCYGNFLFHWPSADQRVRDCAHAAGAVVHTVLEQPISRHRYIHELGCAVCRDGGRDQHFRSGAGRVLATQFPRPTPYTILCSKSYNGCATYGSRCTLLFLGPYLWLHFYGKRWIFICLYSLELLGRLQHGIFYLGHRRAPQPLPLLCAILHDVDSRVLGRRRSSDGD